MRFKSKAAKPNSIPEPARFRLMLLKILFFKINLDLF